MVNFPVNIEIETSYYSTFARNDVPISNAFRELIDNSTSSYFEHKDELEKMGVKRCFVQITWNDEQIVVQDNAYGMDSDGFSRAFKLNAKPKTGSALSRNEYGMGLKYAALSLGTSYTVDTMELNSGKRLKMTLDAMQLKDTNQKELSASSFDVQKRSENHGTKIIIEHLTPESKFSKFNTVGKKKIGLKKLITQLSYIYSYDLDQGNLDLVINEEKVLAPEFKYYINPDTGADVFKNIDGKFKYDGEEYCFSGFVGMLDTGSVDNAGFSLIQKGRAIEINYRPESLFGKSNDFRYQRVYGEITLDGGNWEVTFTKSRIKIPDEMREALNDAIIHCDGVKDIFDKAKTRRSRNESNVSVQDLISSGGKTGDSKSATKVDEKPVVISPVEIVNMPLDVPNKQIVKVDLPAPPVSEDKETYFLESYNGVDYKFYVQPDDQGEMKGTWFKISVKDKDLHEYYIKVNTTVGLIKELSSSAKNKSSLVKLAIKIALAQLASESNGLKLDSSQIMIDKLNELISKE